MEIRITTQQTLQVLYIISWIIFFGVCIEAGGILFNSFYIAAINSSAPKFWEGLDLSSLYHYDTGHFFVQTLFMSIVAILKAILFYLIVKILHEKKLDMAQPFNEALRSFMVNASYLSLGIGLFSWRGIKYAEWLVSQGVSMPDLSYLKLDGASVWFFMSVILFVLAQIFKRGMEIQAEHDLTV